MIIDIHSRFVLKAVISASLRSRMDIDGTFHLVDSFERVAETIEREVRVGIPLRMFKDDINDIIERVRSKVRGFGLVAGGRHYLELPRRQ